MNHPLPSLSRASFSLLSAFGMGVLVASFPDAAMAGIDRTSAAKLPPVAMMTAKISKQLDLADFALSGNIRIKGKGVSKHYPIILRTKGHELVYEFTDQPLQINVQINVSGAVVQRRESSAAPWVTVTGAKLKERILDTDMTYDDLALDFINWDSITPLGTDSIKTLPAYAYEAVPGPGDSSSYSKVDFWVSTQYWAFLRIDGINAQNQLVKRVEVQSVLTIDKFTCFKEMKVETMVPGLDDVASSSTFIDVDGKTGASGL